MNSGGTSHGLKWENETYKKKLKGFYRLIFVYIFGFINICLLLSDEANKINLWILKEDNNEHLSLIYRMVLEKFSFKNSKFYNECMTNYLFRHSAISQFLTAVNSFYIAC